MTETLRLASWNVNSLKVRLPHLLDWLAAASPDVLGLQETKTVDANFPRAALEDAGYHVCLLGQPTYNGVAILAKASRFHPPQEVVFNDGRLPDQQARLIACTLTDRLTSESLRLIDAYVPNGSEVGSEKYAYKLAWLAVLHQRLREELSRHPRLALVGDFNIAPADLDVHDPAAWQDKILCSGPERQAYTDLLALGLTDSLRCLHPEAEKLFTWWDYRQAGFRRDLGLRIDHLLVSAPLAGQLRAASVDKGPRRLDKPSDHAPVTVDIGDH